LNFSDLLLAEPILRAVVSEGYTVATPIQAQAIPHILGGRDVLGCAQTGTGKTAAFALPILHKLSQGPRSAKPRALILCPTRELATQIGDSFRVYGKNVALRHATVYGGMSIRPQIDILRRGVDVVIATPGRLLDLMGQNCCDLSGIELLVLDEADRMLDMGFIVDIRKIISRIPAQRQTLMFSATMPSDIQRLASAILRDAVTVKVAQQSPAADKIEQSVYYISREEKPALLAQLVKDMPMTRPLVFTRTKHGADRLVRRLYNSGIRSEAIHGNKSQNARQRALEGFRAGRIHVLVATDVASRGIDVDGISHVVNYDVTDEPETYIHRIGRTARAGASGSAITLCDPQERSDLRAIERLMGKSIPVKSARLNSPSSQQAAAQSEGNPYAGQQPAPQGTPKAPHSAPHSAPHAAPHKAPHAAPHSGPRAPHSAGQPARHSTAHSTAHSTGHSTGHSDRPAPAERMRQPQHGAQHPIRGRHHAAPAAGTTHRKGQDRRQAGAGRFRMV